jgi:hypothetical protein
MEEALAAEPHAGIPRCRSAAIADRGARRLAGPPHGEPDADQAGGEQMEAEQDVEPALIANGPPAEAGEPGQPAFARQGCDRLDDCSPTAR